jgi:ubiquinone/menaquinone biosynthesis C-methylase UbiE
MVESRSFDPIWEEKYAAGHVVNYPWDVVVSFVFRNAPRDKPRHDIRILELGCGTGANLWFAAREGFQVAGVDGSSSAIRKAQERFQLDGLNGDLRVADFTHLPFDDNSFNLVIDRGSLVCVGFETGKKAIHEVYRVLGEKGRFFFNPYSDRHSSYSSGEVGSDGLVSDISSGTMVGVGQLCFYGRQQVIAALCNFKLLSLQHMEYAEMLEPEWMVHAEWRAIAEKIL